MRYDTYTDLPNHIRKRIEAVAPSRDLAQWVKQPIPALGNRSVLAVMSEDGEAAQQKILQFLLKIEGYFS